MAETRSTALIARGARGARPKRRLTGSAALAILAAACLAALAHAQTEYQVKAAFLYNIARFIDWPPQAIASNTLSLCLLGDDPFGSDINIIAGKPVGTARLQVRRISLNEAAGCQILFISNSEAARLGRVLDAVKGQPILTIGDAPGFAGRGAVMDFYLEENKVRFEINVDAARRNRLTISSQLLRLARITHDQSGANG